MISLSLHPLPRQNEWNALVTYNTDPLEQQNIQHMENITMPKNQINVVLDTLSVREECRQEYAVVTYAYTSIVLISGEIFKLFI